ncbi:hypothetical protein PR048_024797 [Dryococelus australis]|uniref:Reverse transcriptase/retrotransposon-derived protein RNase H-like domain-containing protein n=1 Tax=Dryococelus australis TaxID=614101 RepID=A0ABQ9GPI8_9NEOP|nr:hypothetical protein PR048_024797 [Dryococelus australis]
MWRYTVLLEKAIVIWIKLMQQLAQCFAATLYAISTLASHQGEPGFHSPAGPPDFRKVESCRTMPLVGGFFSGISRFPCPFIHSITLIVSEDSDVKSHPNIFTHSTPSTCTPTCRNSHGLTGSITPVEVAQTAREVVGPSTTVQDNFLAGPVHKLSRTHRRSCFTGLSAHATRPDITRVRYYKAGRSEQFGAIADKRHIKISRNALDADTLRRTLLHPDWLQLIASQRIASLYCRTCFKIASTALLGQRPRTSGCVPGGVEPSFSYFGNMADVAGVMVTTMPIVRRSEEQQKALETFKRDIMHPPVFRIANISKNLFVKTDASSSSIGAVLVQETVWTRLLV